MKESDFTATKGRLISSEDGSYQSFVPAYLPINLDYNTDFVSLLEKASQKLGELKTLSVGLDSSIGFAPQLFIKPYLRQEAVLSSRIENTISTLYDVLEAEALGSDKLQSKDESLKGDLFEVLNYVRAQNAGIEMIENGGAINIDLITRLHSILLRNVRGERAKPGLLRDKQKWISRGGFPDIKDAVYVPPPANLVPELLNNLFNYMESSDDPQLIKIALMHYQFEAIHPFWDGNGRIGRLLIIMYLIKRGLLTHPFLYMSDYFERNRELYYNLLMNVSKTGAYEEWIKFFLIGIIEQSDSVINKTRALLSYYSEIRKKLGNTREGVAMKLADYIFTHPIITIPNVARDLDVSYPAIKKAVVKFIDLGILEKSNNRATSSSKKPMIFIAPEIIEKYEA